MPKIPLIEDLTSHAVPPGSNILVVFDPASDWYNASFTIAAGWLRTGGRVQYNVTIQSPANVRSQLSQRGLNVEELEREDTLRIYDWYSLMLGRKSLERYSGPSLKVSELSPAYSSWMKGSELGETASTLRMLDNGSNMARFNDEKLWVEFILTRQLPRGPIWKATLINPIVRGLHSEWVYRSLEAAVDGIVDFKLEESGEETRHLMRIRNMRNVGFDRKWHVLRTRENSEVTLEK